VDWISTQEISARRRLHLRPTERGRSRGSRRAAGLRFLSVALRRRILGLVHDGLRRARLDVPPVVGREIAAQSAQMVRENLAMAAEALRLQRLFDEADLLVLSIKCASLACWPSALRPARRPGYRSAGFARDPLGSAA